MTQQWWYRNESTQDVNINTLQLFELSVGYLQKLDESYGTNKDLLLGMMCYIHDLN